MNNKSDYNKLFNLNHKSDYYLTNNYEDNLQNNEFNDDNIMNVDYNIHANNNYINNNAYNTGKRYSFSGEKKGYKFK